MAGTEDKVSVASSASFSVDMARKALAILRGENPDLARALETKPPPKRRTFDKDTRTQRKKAAKPYNLLPGFACRLEKNGAEVSVDILLEHARLGEAHIRNFDFGRDLAPISYESVLGLPAFAYDDDPAKRAVQAAQRGDIPTLEKAVPALPPDSWKEACITAAAAEGQTGMVRHLAETRDVPLGNLVKGGLRDAAWAGHFELFDYLRSKVAEQDLQHQLTCVPPGLAARHAEWNRVARCYPPVGLGDEDPALMRHKSFAAVAAMLRKEGIILVAANKAAFQATSLFGTEERVLQYLGKWKQPNWGKPLTELIFFSHISMPGKIPERDRAIWADAVIKCGPKMGELTPFSNIMLPRKSSDGETWSMVNTRAALGAELGRRAFARAAENPKLAALCVHHVVGEKRFNEALDIVNATPVVEKNIPDLEIDGERFGMPGAKLFRLPPGDPRALFIGEDVNQCQSVGRGGASCAKHSYASPDGGIYAVADARGNIIGETWAWRGQRGEMVLDSLETLADKHAPRITHNQWTAILREMAREIDATKGSHNVTRLLCGEPQVGDRLGGALSKVFRVARKRALPKWDNSQYMHWEATRQVEVWKRPAPRVGG